MSTRKKTGTRRPEIMVYVGPTIAGVATHNTFLNNGITPELEKAAKKEPAFKSLVIPAADLASEAANLRSGKGAISMFYRKAAAYQAD